MKRAEGEIAKTDNSDVAWAVAWRNRRTSFLSNEQKLRERVEQFVSRSSALNSWSPENEQLRATGMLCNEVSTTDPGPLQRLRKLVNDYREKLSVETWPTLLKVPDFAAKLRSVEFEVQSLLYRQLQAFSHELETIKNEYWVLLPATPPPVFETPVGENIRSRSRRNSFNELYGWTLTGFRSVIADCRKRKENGVPWRDHSASHISWKDMDGQVERALQAINGSGDFKNILHAGDKILRMLRGFDSGNGKLNGSVPAVYDNPARPPDFDHLEEIFVRGQVVIRVEPKRSSTYDKKLTKRKAAKEPSLKEIFDVSMGLYYRRKAPLSRNSLI